MNPSLLLAALVLAADPTPALGPTYAGASSSAARSSNVSWWTRFADPELNTLVKQGTANNFSVLTAQSRIDEADAVVAQQLAPLLPTATWDTSLTTGPLDSLGFQFGGGVGGGAPMVDLPELYWQASSAVNLSIGIDVTGKNVLGHRAAKDDRKAAKDDVAAQRQAVASQIAAAYYDVVTARAQLVIAKKQVETNEQLLELTEAKFDTGQANAVDVLQQRQQVASSKLQIPRAEQQERAFEQRLAVLLGEAPGKRFDTPRSLPGLPAQPDVGAPIDLINTRPDLRAKRTRLEGTEKRTKVARRSFAPNLSLSARGGVQAINTTGDWGNQGFWSATATLSVPIYTGGSTYARMRQAKAQQRTASRDLSQSTLTAVQEVEDALLREAQQREVLKLYEEQYAAAKAAFDESRTRYAEGVAEYLPVFTALSSLQRVELDIVTAKRDLIAARIALYTALGDR